MTPAPCQCRCFYCEIDKVFENSSAVEKGYEKTFEFLEFVDKFGIIHPNAAWQVSSGEITIHPYRERIFSLVGGHACMFYTNGFRFDQGIAEILHKNPHARVEISIDSGTAPTWQKVKGVDNFGTVLQNLAGYKKAAAGSGQMMMKYIVLPGVNDNDEDFCSVIEIMKRLEISHLSISLDLRVKDTMRGFDRAKLLNGAAYLLALLNKNGFTGDAYAYSGEDQSKIVRMATALLQERSG